MIRILVTRAIGVASAVVVFTLGGSAGLAAAVHDHRALSIVALVAGAVSVLTHEIAARLREC